MDTTVIDPSTLSSSSTSAAATTFDPSKPLLHPLGAKPYISVPTDSVVVSGLRPLSVFSILSGLAVFLLSFSQDFGDITSVCSSSIPPITGLPPLDSFLCFIVPFFQRAAMSPEGRFATFLVLGAALPLAYFIGIESGRQGVTGITRYPAFFLFLGQLLGLGAVANVFFVPAFLRSEANAVANLSRLYVPRPLTQLPRGEAVGDYFRGVLASHARLVLGLSAGFVALTMAMMNCHPISPVFVVLNTAFQFSPLLFGSVNLFLPSPPSPTSHIMPAENARIIRLGYVLIIGFCVATYYEYLFEMLAHCGVLNPPAPISLWAWLNSIPDNLAKLDFTDPAVRFLLIDLAGITLAPLIILYNEYLSVSKFALLLVMSVLFSPGAAIAYLLHEREDVISGLGDFFGIKPHLE